MLIVVLLLSGSLAKVNAPRTLQSFAAAVHADADPAALSSVLSTVIVVLGAAGTTLSALLAALSISTSVTPLSFLGSASTATGALSDSRMVLGRSPTADRPRPA